MGSGWVYLYGSVVFVLLLLFSHPPTPLVYTEKRNKAARKALLAFIIADRLDYACIYCYFIVCFFATLKTTKTNANARWCARKRNREKEKEKRSVYSLSVSSLNLIPFFQTIIIHD